jgi:3-dehydroquinate synthase
MIVPIKLTPPKPGTFDITTDPLPKLTYGTNVVIVTNPTVAGYHL